jgi:hypothetical protein
LRDLDVKGRIILKYIIIKYDIRGWIGFIWFRIGLL